jgi:hypothetical protein
MTPVVCPAGQSHSTATTAGLTRELEELIAALDRRLPRVGQAGEAAIARDAAVLRRKAVGRLVELAQHSLPSQLRGQWPPDVESAGQYAKNSVPDESP